MIFSKKTCGQKYSIDGNFKPKFKSYHDFKQHLCLYYNINDLKSDYFIQNYGLNSISILDDFKVKTKTHMLRNEILLRKRRCLVYWISLPKNGSNVL